MHFGDVARGSTGSEVYQAQALLKGLGYPITVDSIFGPKTEAAVKAFQQSVGLPVTGVVDGPTIAALAQAGGTPNPEINTNITQYEFPPAEVTGIRSWLVVAVGGALVAWWVFG